MEPREVRALADAATAADGVAPLSEETLLVLPGALTERRDGGELVAFGTTGEGTGELVVHPAHRRRGLGCSVLAEVLGGVDRVWAHGDLPAAAAFASAAGLTRGRELHRLRRPAAEPLPTVTWPDGVQVRPFRPGRDEDAWLAVNAAAFAHHPEQGRWTRADLDAREGEAWFDPAGFFLAWRGDRLVGFHWTKVAGGEGEVYVVGVDPAEAGAGLGRALTVRGLEHLAGKVPTVTLYVDGDNARARAMYERLGFVPDALDVTYVRG